MREKFIEEGEYLLEHYEWSGGIIPKPKEIRRRRKLVDKGDADIVLPEDWFKKKRRRKIVRKVR